MPDWFLILDSEYKEIIFNLTVTSYVLSQITDYTENHSQLSAVFT